MTPGLSPKPWESWRPPDEWRRVETIDAHTAGEPLRVFRLDLPELSRGPVSDRRAWAMKHQDELRRVLMWEPRGHREMYGCIVMPSERADSHVGVMFMHNEGFSTMCGHGIIAVTTVLLETGVLPSKEPSATVRIDTPAGLVVAEAQIRGKAVQNVAFENVPSFVSHPGMRVTVPEYGELNYDIAFGGAFYAYVDAAQLGLQCLPDEYDRLVSAGRAIKRAVSESVTLTHPDDVRLGFLYGTILLAPPILQGSHSRNVCIFADGQVDRSPTGTGVSGRLAIHHSRGEIQVGESIRIESILGTTFDCSIQGTTKVGALPAVVPRVEGSAFITGKHTFLVDPEDPLRGGFIL